MEKVLDSSTFSLMQTGEPYKSYIKTILAKVYVTVLNPFSNEPEGRILSGNPRAKDENSIIDTWNEKEDVFFKRMNKRHLESGTVIVYRRLPEVVEVSPNEVTDEEITTLLNSKFLALQNKVNKMTSVAPVFRVLTIAKELEKSEKIIKFLEGKISELQLKEYSQE
jgi:hypothetical protein